MACLMHLWSLHFSIVSEARNARVTFVEKPKIKNIQFSKWESWIFNAILDQTKLWRVLLWIRIILILFLIFKFWVSAMQCNVECRLPEEDEILKDPPPHMSTPSEEARVGRGAGNGHPPVRSCTLFSSYSLQKF